MIQQFLFNSWFIIASHSPAINNQHNYLVEIKQNNVKINITLDQQLKYKVGQYVKLKLIANCTKSQQPTVLVANRRSRVVGTHNAYLCDSDQVRVVECTESNSFVVGGIRYC